MLNSVKTFKQHRILGYSSKQMYLLVSDINNYEKFVPWCISSKITNTNETSHQFIQHSATLEIGFRNMASQTYSSIVNLYPHQLKIHASADQSLLFKRLHNTWSFKNHPSSPNSCIVDFQIEFLFNNLILQHTSGLFFDEAAKTIMSSFEDRALKIYGTPCNLSKASNK